MTIHYKHNANYTCASLTSITHSLSILSLCPQNQKRKSHQFKSPNTHGATLTISIHTSASSAHFPGGPEAQRPVEPLSSYLPAPHPSQPIFQEAQRPKHPWSHSDYIYPYPTLHSPFSGRPRGPNTHGATLTISTHTSASSAHFPGGPEAQTPMEPL